ncbi:MAG: transcription antitermination factor NusB [Lachnospiraceae bacterium]|nr:transcription antitermination factor NusB [Lachnospiraceae bacterium]
MNRSQLREHVFRTLFRLDFYPPNEMEREINLYMETLNPPDEDSVAAKEGEAPLVKEKDIIYIENKVKKIIEKVPEIDEVLSTLTVKWKLSRMSKVDLTILRLAVYEMKWDEDVPIGAAIDEAVELSKKYSGDEGYSFVNGVLAKVAKEMEKVH